MPVELTTVAITSATFHTHGDGAPVVETLDDLAPGTLHEHAGISFTTLPRPAGALRSRFATVNDVHFGEVESPGASASPTPSGRCSVVRRAPRRTRS